MTFQSRTFATLRESKLARNGRGTNLALKGWALDVTTPFPSFISISPVFSHSKHCIKHPNATPTISIASLWPGQALLPQPKGKYLNSNSNSVFPPSNLLGKNLSGSFHVSGLLWISHAFTNSMVPRGTRNPSTQHSSDETCGVRSGAAGCIRSVSLMMHPRYGSSGRSDSSMRWDFPTRLSISALALARMVCWFARRWEKAHSSVVAVVCVAPWIITC